jgi:hypothetical protein
MLGGCVSGGGVAVWVNVVVTGSSTLDASTPVVIHVENLGR